MPSDTVVLAQPSVTGGVTQNPAQTADPGRVRDSLNFWPIPRSGLVRRAPTEYRAVVSADTGLKTRLIPVDLGGDDRFVAAVSHDQIQAFRRNGDQIDIWGVTRDADGNITGGTTPDYSYLDFRNDNALREPEAFTTTGPGPWVLAGGALVPFITSGKQSPLGWPTHATLLQQDNYTILRASAGAGQAAYQQLNNGHLWTKKWTLAAYVNLDSAGALPAYFGLMVWSPAEGTKHRVVWDLTGGPSVAPPVLTNTMGFEVPAALRVRDNEYRLGFVFDPARSTGTPGAGNTVQFEVELERNAGSEVRIETWGAQLTPHSPATELAPYDIIPETLRTASAGASIFVANPSVPTRLTAAVSDTFAQVYPSLTFTGDPGPLPVKDAGYVFMKQGVTASAAGGYTITVIVRDTLGAGGTKTIIFSPGGAAPYYTDVEAPAIAAGLNGHAANTDGVGRVIECFAQGSVVKIVSKDNTAGGSVWEIIEIRSQDLEGDSLFSTYTDRVDDKSDLPLRGPAQHGHVVKLVEVAEDKDDFQVPQMVLRFEGDDDTFGVFGTGRWVEGTDYGVRTTLDPATLPHVLAYRLDDGSGTVTGKADEPYFEWGPHTWVDRVVGDDDVNPVPSFVTPAALEGVDDRYVDGVSFFANRLVLASGLNLAASETSVYGNFWRSTLRALPDSDRIDIVLSVPGAARATDVGVFAGRLFVRTARGVQVITSSGALSPRTVGVETVFDGGLEDVAQSVAAGPALLAPGDGVDRSGVTLLFPSGSDTLAFQDLELSEDAPFLLVPESHTLAWASALSSLFVHSRNDSGRVYGCRVSQTDRQVAWYPMDVAGDPVHSLCVLAGELLLLVAREDGSHLEAARLDEIQRDAGQPWRVYLDRRVTEQDLTTPMVFGGTNTTITLPYTPTTGADVVVTARSGSSFGAKKTVVSVVGAVVTVAGDVTAEELIIGEVCPGYVKPLPPVLRDEGALGPVPYASSTHAVREVALGLHDSAHLEVLVQPPDGAKVAAFVWDTEHKGAVPLSSRPQRVGVGSEASDADVTITAPGHKPLNLVGLEWQLTVGDRAARRVAS